MDSIDRLIDQVAEACKIVMKEKIESNYGSKIISGRMVKLAETANTITIFIPKNLQGKDIQIHYRSYTDDVK
jgi:hypothetical protein